MSVFVSVKQKRAENAIISSNKTAVRGPSFFAFGLFLICKIDSELYIYNCVSMVCGGVGVAESCIVGRIVSRINCVLSMKYCKNIFIFFLFTQILFYFIEVLALI